MSDGISIGTACTLYDPPTTCFTAGREIDAPAAMDRACPPCKARALLGQRHGAITRDGILTWTVHRTDTDGSLGWVTDHLTRRRAEFALALWIAIGEVRGHRP